MIENIEAANVESALDEALRHHQAGRLNAATPIYRQVLSVAPDHARALHLLGIAEHQAGRHAPAIDLMERAIEQQPDRAELHNDLAQAYMAANRPVDATRACRRAVELRPDYADACLCLAASLHAQGAVDEAIGHYQQAVKLSPDLADAHFGLANAMMQSGRADEAIAGYDRTLALVPEYLGARVNLGHALKAQQKFDAAAAHYRQALASSPEHADIHASLGDVLTSLGAFEAALESYERALAIDADQQEVIACVQNLGRQLRAAGQLELAARAFILPSTASAAGRMSSVTTQADRMVYAMPERFNSDILRVATAENVFNADEIARIDTIAAEFELISGGVEGPLLHNESVRRSSVRWFKRTGSTYWIYARLMEHILELNDRYWQFDLNLLSDDIQYGEYAESGHYTWHMDLGGGNLSTRKLSFSVQLSSPGEYAGGELELKDATGTVVAPRSQGTLIVFPSFLMHRVAPVSRGLRRSLVGWASGTHPYR